jgi:glycogen synthase
MIASMTRPRSGLKILMTADAVGGVWTYALDLARACQTRGMSFVLATMGPPPSAAQAAEALRIPNLRLEVSEYKLEWMPEPWADVDAAGQWLLGLERRERPDVVHLNGFAHGALPFEAPVIMVGHSCCLSWWRAAKEEDAPAAWDTYRRRVRAGISGATAFIAPTDAMLESFRHLYGPLPAARTLHNGARPNDRPCPKDPVILSAGRLWDEAKNIAILSQAARALPWPVLVAGPSVGPIGSPPRIAGLVRLGHLGRIDMAAALARAAIYAHPAKYEPFGLLPLEAALAGCSLVLSDIPTLREIWGSAAIYADPSDPGHWAAQLRLLIAHPDLLAQTAAAAQRRARRYSLDRFAAAYTVAYAELCSASPPALAPRPLTHFGA